MVGVDGNAERAGDAAEGDGVLIHACLVFKVSKDHFIGDSHGLAILFGSKECREVVGRSLRLSKDYAVLG